MLDAVDLPDNIADLKAMLIAAQAREARKDERIERLEKLVAAFKQGCRSGELGHHRLAHGNLQTQ
ncbi:hypothetical protein ELH01_08365 [Rhizobium ruizarguesonis]|nr:hypothetical protein ELH01_08365 [Rhizobium ruizarguesonis]